MTARSFVLAAVLGLWPMLAAPAQTLAPPPAADDPRPIKLDREDTPAKLRQMQEDVTVFRVLFNRSVARYYNFPAGHKDLAHVPPAAEGVYLKSQGVIYTSALPYPATHPLKKAAAAQAENSPWDRTRLELRGEKPAVETKPADASRISLSEHLLSLLAENGHHFSKLAEEERITIAVTLRPAQECSRCHEVLTERRMTATTMGGFTGYRVEPPKTVVPSPAAPPSYGVGSATPVPAVPAAPRDDEQIDIQLGDLAMKQGRYKEAEDAYMRIIQKLSTRKEVEGDVRRLSLLSEVCSKLAQCEIALGQAEKAKQALEMALKAAEAAVKFTEKSGKEKMPPLPPQLILSATKSQLDQVASHKMSFEEFSKAATVEYRTFDAPEGKKEGTK